MASKDSALAPACNEKHITAPASPGAMTEPHQAATETSIRVSVTLLDQLVTTTRMQKAMKGKRHQPVCAHPETALFPCLFVVPPNESSKYHLSSCGYIRRRASIQNKISRFWMATRLQRKRTLPVNAAHIDTGSMAGGAHPVTSELSSQGEKQC